MSIERLEKSYFIVKVFLIPAHGAREGNWSWLATSGGYKSHSTMESGAEHFKEPPTLQAIRSYSGKPWYDVHDGEVPPRTFHVKETHITDMQEVI